GFASRRPGGKQRDGQAGQQGGKNGPAAQGDFSRAAADVERIDRRAHQLYGKGSDETPNGNSQQRAGDADEGRFQEKCTQHLRPACAYCANDADFGAATHNRDRNGVVNKKGADYERDVAQKPQVPTEGAEHAAVLLGRGTSGAKLNSCRKGLFDALPPLCKRSGGISGKPY